MWRADDFDAATAPGVPKDCEHVFVFLARALQVVARAALVLACSTGLSARATTADEHLTEAVAAHGVRIPASAVGAVRAEGRAAFEAAGLDEAHGDRVALGALLISGGYGVVSLPADAYQRLGPPGVARVLLRESADFYATDLGGALLIVAIEDPSVPESFARGQASARDVILRSQRLLANRSEAERASTLMKARAAAQSVPPPVLVAAAVRSVRDQAEFRFRQTVLTPDELVAYLVMHRGMKDDPAQALAWAISACSGTNLPDLVEEWRVLESYSDGEAQASVDVAEHGRDVMTSAKPLMPLAAAVVLVLAAAVLFRARTRARATGALADMERAGAYASGALVVVTATGLLWMAVSDGAAGDDEMYGHAPLAIAAVAALSWILEATIRRRGEPAALALLAGGHAGAARTTRVALSFGLLAFPVGMFAVPVAAGIMAAQDISWLVLALMGRRPPRRTWWRRALVVLTWVVLWLVVNPLGAASDSDAAMLPLVFLLFVFIPASVVSDIVSLVRWILARRRVSGPVAPTPTSLPVGGAADAPFTGPEGSRDGSA